MEEKDKSQAQQPEQQSEATPSGFESEFFKTEVRRIYEMQTQVIETLNAQKDLTTSQFKEIHEISKDLREIMVSNAAKTNDILKISNFIVTDVGPAFESFLQKIEAALSDEKALMQEILRYQQEGSGASILEQIASEGKTFRHLLANLLKNCNGIQETATTISQNVEIVKARTLK